MKEFENNTEYELPEDEAAALRMTLNECLDNATDAQLEAIHNYALGLNVDEGLQARIGLVDYLNDCTATAYQTGNLNLLENMHKVVTTVHDLIGDYPDSEQKLFKEFGY